MDNIIAFPRPAPKDGGKARILARRELIGLAKQGGPIVESPESLVRADHAGDIQTLQAGMLLPPSCA